MRKIPIFTLNRQNRKYKSEFRKTIEVLIDKGIYILGENVLKFEERFAEYLGVRYAVGVASGTDALTLALMAAGVREGDEVILPANSYPTVFAVTAIGARPVLVDIDADTFNIDPDKIEKAVTKKTKAVIAVHLYGQAADLGRIMPIVRKHNLIQIEDCAQAHGGEIKVSSIKYQVSSIKNKKIHNTKYLILNTEDKPDKTDRETEFKKVGSIGDIGCFSFYPTKNLGCFGDGGMVVTNNEKIYEKIRLLRMYGEKKRYESVILGRNSRLDELQAAVLLVKLKYLTEWNKRRREIAKQYVLSIKYQVLGIKLPEESEYARHVYHLFVIRSPSTSLRVNNRDKLKEYLEHRGIQTGIHYPAPIHLQPSFKYLGYKLGDFPESEKACREVLSLPMFPELKDEEVEYVAEAVNRFMIHDL